ncbi:response regulator [Treponema sp. OttesenSCG-928-L16]|nr:response regulator [Treponema sp. OttesenSCG-928-L16]
MDNYALSVLDSAASKIYPAADNPSQRISEAVHTIVSEIDAGEGGWSFLLGEQGKYLFFGKGDKDQNDTIKEDFDPHLAALGDEVLGSSSGVTGLVYESVPYRVYYTSLGTRSWKLGMCIRESEIATPLHTFMIRLLIPVLALLLGITAISLLLARVLNRRVSQINQFSARAAAGYMNERITPDKKDIEFNRIAENLNTMMENMAAMNSAKVDFLSRMSHEIRTPMNAIIGMAQIGKNTDDPEKIKQSLLKIEENSQHLLGILNDILDFSKIESGKLVFNEELFSLKGNIDFIRSMFKSQAEQKKLNFKVDVQNIKHDGIITDSLRLNQVLINLISNAVKFTDPGGSVAFSAEELFHIGGESVYSFSVSDTGIGIEAEQAKKLFTPFSQANASISSHYGGTGLGLAIAKSIIEILNGEIKLITAPGKGSSFSFTIRVKAQDTAAKPEQEEPQLPDFTGKRLLVVDDVEINREVAMELLRGTGIEMEAAQNGKQAVDMFRGSGENYYDMILMDMQMPVMDGCSASREIRSSGRPDAESVKIIAMTANVLDEDVKKAFDSGMNAYAAKPIVVSEVYRIMENTFKGEFPCEKKHN